MRTLLICAVFVMPIFAGIPADAVWQVQTVSSSDNNGGCWANSQKGATGVDMSQGAPTTITATLSGVGTTTLTDSNPDFANTMLGNCINIAGQGVYVIQGFTDTTHVVVDRALGTFSGASAEVGGPIASLGFYCQNLVTFNVAYFKNDGTFSITSATPNVSAGTCNRLTVINRIIGYTSNRNPYNTDSPATIQVNVASATVFATNGAAMSIFNFILDGNSQSNSRASSGGIWINSTIKNFTLASQSNGYYYNVLATGNVGSVFLLGGCVFCEAYGNTGTPFSVGATLQGSYCIYCLSYSNTGATTDGFSYGGQQNLTCAFCTAYANGRDGIVAGFNNVQEMFLNTYSEGNTTNGYNITGTNTDLTRFFIGLGYYNNGTNFTAPNGVVSTTAITPTGSAFNSSTDLGFNNTGGAGALLRSTALPSYMPRGLTPTQLDGGSTRHLDSTTPRATAFPVTQ